MRIDTIEKGLSAETIIVLEAEAKAALPVIESCTAMGLKVVAASSKKHCCGFYSQGIVSKFRYPPCQTEPEKCINIILNYLREHNISVIFPVGDAMTDLIAQHQNQIRQYTNLVLPPYDVFVKGRSKIETLKTAETAGCAIPKTWYPNERSLEYIATETEYPVLIKPTISCGARGMTRCENRTELLDRFSKIEHRFGQCFVQEFVPQGGMQYKVDLVMDKTQNLLAGVVYAKLRFYPATGGSSVLNKTEYHPDILQAAAKVAKQLRWVGLCDFDFIKDPRDNVVKLMEINPRYPESFRATVAAGVDMTRIIYELAKGQEPQPQLDYLENRYNRFLFGDIMWFLTTKENRWKQQPPFFSFFRKDTLYQLIRARDWGPIIGYVLENANMIFDKKAREFKLRLKNA